MSRYDCGRSISFVNAQVLLNHEMGSPQAPLAEPGEAERMRLSRLKLAIKLRQKKASPAPGGPRGEEERSLELAHRLQFVAHPNVQQLLASIWYESVPGFRRKNMLLQAAEMVRIGAMFPLYSLAYIAAPHSAAGRTLRKPFIKFLCHSASYFMFLCECAATARGPLPRVVADAAPACSFADPGVAAHRDGGGRVFRLAGAHLAARRAALAGRVAHPRLGQR